MQEMTLEDQMRAQLNLQEQQAIPQQVNRNRKPRVKKVAKPLLTNEEINESLKTEIEMLPMKTPISILQELLSRRGNWWFFYVKIFIDFSLIFESINLSTYIHKIYFPYVQNYI